MNKKNTDEIDKRYITENAETTKRIDIGCYVYNESKHAVESTKTIQAVINDTSSMDESEYKRNWDKRLNVLFAVSEGTPALTPIVFAARDQQKQAYLVEEVIYTQSTVNFSWYHVSKITEFQLEEISRETGGKR